MDPEDEYYGDGTENDSPYEDDAYEDESDTEDNAENIYEDVTSVRSAKMMTLLEKYKKDYDEMDKTQMWSLKTGRTVEKIIFDFGMQCNHEHLVHSWTIDVDDRQIKILFNSLEWNEILETNQKEIPNIPQDLLDYFNSFRKKSTIELRQALYTKQPWQVNYDPKIHFDLEWVYLSILSLIKEYEADTFKKTMLEVWYLVHCWSLIDKCFLDVKNLMVVRGEGMSLASSNRKNEDRLVAAISKTARKRIGRKGDLVLRKSYIEFGGGEAGCKYDGKNGTKILKERGLKLPKMLRDMLMLLCESIGNNDKKIRQLEVIGYVFSELKFQLLRADLPVGYICRIRRTPMEEFAVDVSNFYNTIRSMVLIWKSKAIIMKTIEIFEGDSDDDNLENVGKKTHSTFTYPKSSITPKNKKAKT